MEKGNALWQSYNSHDCETFYKCSLCKKPLVIGAYSTKVKMKMAQNTIARTVKKN